MKGKRMLFVVMTMLFAAAGILSPALAQERYFQPSKIIVKPTFKIDVWVDKGCGGTYRIGDKLTIYFKSTKDCYLTLFDVSPGGQVRLLFPNRYRTDNFFEANKVHAIPAKDDNFEFEVTPPPGKETIRAVATLTSWYFMSKENLRKGDLFPIISKSTKEFTPEFERRIRPIPRVDRAIAECTFTVAGITPRYGKIRVTSDPSYAKVYLDGDYRGRTPTTIRSVRVGKHQIKVTKKDYYDWSETVRVRPNLTTRVFARLEPIPKTGSIYVTSSPSHARVFLDGIEKGTTPLPITDIEIGWHQVVIIKEYYRVYLENVYIEGGEELHIKVDLERI